MNNSVLGMLMLAAIGHFILILIPLVNSIQAPISARSKVIWCLFLILLPLVGVTIFHFRYRSGLFQGKSYEVSSAEERARSGTLSPSDFD